MTNANVTNVFVTSYCKDNNSNDLTIAIIGTEENAIEVERYIFDSPFYIVYNRERNC
mgnify:CR=1 FL=1